jgi:hypothetical protein
MFENEFVDNLEENNEYKLGVLQEFLSKYNYHLYSKTISIGCHEQQMCAVSKVINKKLQCLSNPHYTSNINYAEVEGIIFAELAL